MTELGNLGSELWLGESEPNANDLLGGVPHGASHTGLDIGC